MFGQGLCWVLADHRHQHIHPLFFFPPHTQTKPVIAKGKSIKSPWAPFTLCTTQSLGYISPHPRAQRNPEKKERRRKKGKEKAARAKRIKKKIRKVPRAHDSKGVPNFWPPAPLGVGGKLLVAQPPRLSLFLLSTHPAQARLPSFSSVLIPPRALSLFLLRTHFPPVFPLFLPCTHAQPQAPPVFPLLSPLYFMQSEL